MITDYLNQTAVWGQKIGTDVYGNPNIVQTTIPARFEGRRMLVQSRDNQQVVSTAAVFVKAPVSEGDTLTDPQGREWTVLSVQIEYNLDGSEAFREVAL
ncbi:hypothetical protein [Meiothermus granaticius]|uniref:Phage head-tail joining protein n=1 Tax=Meiothermus granaticius NBRC 107808 TaxID=1227551 RepID=A0A399FFE1_9DEIN|nr:hypothetical protein [Meiothermus granaticius]RIH93992.1 hypothetical protein Mgrana_00078 [Meiothermus granaticius NBRC 107808]GEM88179.1 hypothetical protein MGR01S_28040 [Meiothermus granaticius NBRC 107808]